jgi:hypothetical protein
MGGAFGASAGTGKRREASFVIPIIRRELNLQRGEADERSLP